MEEDPTGKATEPISGASPEEPENTQAKAVSPQKLAANRSNAQLSSGPRTPEGKQTSSQNARKHGFFARQPIPVGPEGDKLWMKYNDLYQGLFEHYEPVGYLEKLLTEKIATEYIRLSILLAYEGVYAGGGAIHVDGVNLVLRFQSAINRQLFLTMKELERLQEKRKGQSES
jgi:hypothetical protein